MLRSKKRFIVAILMLCAVVPCLVYQNIPYEMCLTSNIDTKSDWVLGQVRHNESQSDELRRRFSRSMMENIDNFVYIILRCY